METRVNRHVFPTREQLILVISLMWPFLLADWIAERGKMSAEEIASCYGRRGVHYDVEGGVA